MKSAQKKYRACISLTTAMRGTATPAVRGPRIPPAAQKKRDARRIPGRPVFGFLLSFCARMRTVLRDYFSTKGTRGGEASRKVLRKGFSPFLSRTRA